VWVLEAVLRDVIHVQSGKNTPIQISEAEVDNRIPIEATRVITATNDGSSTDTDPFIVNFTEGY